MRASLPVQRTAVSGDLLVSSRCPRPESIAGNSPGGGGTWRSGRFRRWWRPTLENGLKVLLKEDHSSPVISVGCWVRVGSQDAGLGAAGISHFVEHLTFSAGKPPAATGQPWMARHAGGLLQGYTSLDQTAYFASVVTSGLEDLLELAARPLRQQRFETGRIELERGLVIAELLRREDDSRLALDWEVATTALKRHPYRWPAGGWLPDVERINSNQLWDHYRRYYTPDNAILVLVGDFQADRAMGAVRRRFDAIPRRAAPPRVPLSEPEQRGERRLRLTGPGRVPHFQMAFRAPGIHQSDLYGLWVLDAILCRAKGLSVGLERLQESAPDPRVCTGPWSIPRSPPMSTPASRPPVTPTSISCR